MEPAAPALGENPIPLGDRILRSLFVALAVGLGWGIRGDFGHLLGAMFPGAALGLGFAFVTGQPAMLRWAPLMGAVGGLGISTGGHMSYGILHGYAQSDTFVNYTYGLFTLLLQGGAWGTFGCAALGLLFEREKMKPKEWMDLAVTIIVGGLAFWYIVVVICEFQINPPRSNSSIAFTGGALAQFAWLGFSRKWTGLRGALLGYLGFGMGMAGGRLLGNIANVQPYPINHWNVMETSCGMIGGFVFTMGMLGRKFPEAPRTAPFRAASVFGIFYALTGIPLFHRLLRIEDAKKLGEWAERFKGFGHADPEGMSQTVLTALNLVCALGLAGSLIWLWLWSAERKRFAAFPVLWLSLAMLLFQNVNAVYFWYPRQEGSINMHFVFWALFALMLAYAAFAKPAPLAAEGEDESAPPPWRAWLARTAVIFAALVFAAGFVNGEKTMRSANTRWPLWTWTQGPFPGTQATPTPEATPTPAPTPAASK